MNKEEAACVAIIILIVGGFTAVIAYFGSAESENYYELNVSTENEVFLKTANIGTWGKMVWQGTWWDLPYSRIYHKAAEVGIRFKEYVYTDGFYEIAYSNDFYFNYESLLDNDGVAYIVLENATITIAIV